MGCSFEVWQADNFDLLLDCSRDIYNEGRFRPTKPPGPPVTTGRCKDHWGLSWQIYRNLLLGTGGEENRQIKVLASLDFS